MTQTVRKYANGTAEGTARNRLMASALSKKGHKPWDVCECGHPWICHTDDDGPCADAGGDHITPMHCPCLHFTWRAVPEAIEELKSIMEELRPKENNDDHQL